MNPCINYERLDKAIEWFVKYITWSDRSGKVDFYRGHMEKHEGFKRQIARNSHAALQLDKWQEDMIGTGKILDYVLAGMNAADDKKANKNKIIDYRYVQHLENTAKTNLRKAEDILYRLYTKDCEAEVFTDACEFFGRRYPLLSFLFFMKDSTRFLTVNKSDDNHGDRFKRLRIKSSCLDFCSWENYCEFLQIHEEIQNELTQKLDTPVTFLDAHSFVWTLWEADDDFSFKYENLLPNVRNGEGERYIQKTKERIEYTQQKSETTQKLEKEFQKLTVSGAEKEAIVKVRVNQSIFRNRLLLRYKRCCLCPVSNESFLIASHIKPWRESEVDEKLHVDNGFLLCPDHDKLFDQGWISFDDTGKILISEQLSTTDQMNMNVNPTMRVALFEGNKKYLAYHREHIFKCIE